MPKILIQEKYGYNHPHVNEGDPRKHPDWDKWCLGNEGFEIGGYYCKDGSDGTNCIDCVHWYGCIMKMWHWTIMNDYLSGRMDELAALEKVYDEPGVQSWISVFEDLIS